MRRQGKVVDMKGVPQFSIYPIFSRWRFLHWERGEFCIHRGASLKVGWQEGKSFETSKLCVMKRD